MPAHDSADHRPHAATTTPYRALRADIVEIRLLVLQPAPNGPVHCHLEYVSLQSHPIPQYETISYVWGDASIRSTICLAGDEIDVPASSVATLQRMRKDSVPRALWIDAICINQEDSAERAQQVAIMYQIFASGTRNLIWLGDDDDGMTERAIASIRSIIDEMRVETNDFADLSSMLYTKVGVFLYSDVGLSTLVDADAITAFFASPWFTRAWIVQEAALARYSVCYRGSAGVSLADVFHASVWLRFKTIHLPFRREKSLGLVNSAYFAELADSRCGLDPLNLRWNFLSLLTGTRSLLATEPRDHIYALLGLYQRLSRKAVLPESLVPTYNARIEDTFISASTFCVEERNDLDLLESVYRREDDLSRRTGLPTWVPQWDRPFDTSLDPYDFGGALFNASSREAMHPIQPSTSHTGVLVVRGISIGVITDTSHSVRIDQNPDSLIEQIEAWFQDSRALYQAPASETADPLTALVATALVGSKDWNYSLINTADAIAGFFAYKAAIETSRSIPCLQNCNDSTPEEVKSASRYRRAIWTMFQNRRAFRLSTGHIGAGPRIVEVGDAAVVAYGARVPLILRPVGEAEKRKYEVVGVGYVHGVMHGEAVRQHRERGGEDEIFRLV